jgi:hypothetical protein
VLEQAAELSGLTANLGPPPAHTDKQETPVVKELRFLVFERVANELESPSRNEKYKGIQPQPVNQDASQEQGERNQNSRYPQGMA